MNATASRSNPAGMLLLVGFMVAIGFWAVSSLGKGGGATGAVQQVQQVQAVQVQQAVAPAAKVAVTAWTAKMAKALPAIDESWFASNLSYIEEGVITNVPPADDDQLRHAMEQRGIAIGKCGLGQKTEYGKKAFEAGYFKVHMCYDFMRDNMTAVFFSPTGASVLVVAQKAGYPTIVGVFRAVTNAGQLIGYGSPITLLIDNVNLVQARTASCASMQVWQKPGFEPAFEPPPVGKGRCLELGNVH